MFISLPQHRSGMVKMGKEANWR